MKQYLLRHSPTHPYTRAPPPSSSLNPVPLCSRPHQPGSCHPLRLPGPHRLSFLFPSFPFHLPAQHTNFPSLPPPGGSTRSCAPRALRESATHPAPYAPPARRRRRHGRQHHRHRHLVARAGRPPSCASSTRSTPRPSSAASTRAGPRAAPCPCQSVSPSDVGCAGRGAGAGGGVGERSRPAGGGRDGRRGVVGRDDGVW